VLALFTIDPSVLSEQNSLALDGLSRIWVEQRLCVLLDLVDANKNSYFSEAIKALPDSPDRTKWIDIYQAAQKRNLISPRLVKQAPKYPWSDTVVDALISKTDVDVVILEQDRHHQDPSQRVDVLSLGDIHHAKKIVASEDLRLGSVHDANSDLNQLWQENFREELKYATNIHVVDRWIFSRYRLGRGGRGLTKFMELAKEWDTPKGKSTILNIYAESAGDDKNERVENNRRAYGIVRDQIEQTQVKPHPFREINLYMIPTKLFNGVTGARHIRLHDIFVATPDHGMELFELWRSVTLNFNRALENFQSIERRLAANASFARL
jgi:hypothetical protein